MKKKKPYYLLIDIFELKKSTVYTSLVDVAGHIGVHRNTIKNSSGVIYKQWLLLFTNR